MNSIDLFFDDEEDEVVLVENLAAIRRTIRDNSNPMELPNSCFLKSFRLSKEAFTYLLDETNPYIKRCVHSTSVPNRRWKRLSLGISQPMFSKILRELLGIFEKQICPKWITFTMTQREKEEAKLASYEKTIFPGVIGCVDGTHIRIISPRKEKQHVYYNRKGFHSINAMLVCDHMMRIRFVDAKYPGSCHNFFVWTQSSLRHHLQQRYDDGERNCWLLGDSGYPLETFLITPFRNTSEGSIEATFNNLH